MSEPRDSSPITDERPAHRRDREREPRPEKPSRWTPEAIVAAIALAVTVGGSLLALALHAYGISIDVAQLKADAKDHSVEVAARRKEVDARFQAIEFAAQVNKDASDKRETVLENGITGINTKLDALQVSVDQLSQHHH